MAILAIIVCIKRSVHYDCVKIYLSTIKVILNNIEIFDELNDLITVGTCTRPICLSMCMIVIIAQVMNG